MKIYLDMDGVLADFDGGVRKYGFINDNSFIHKPRLEWTEEQKELSNIFERLMASPGYFLNLEPMKDYHQLVDFCTPFGYDVLTAWPRNVKDVSGIIQDKKDWCDKYLNDYSEFICCDRSEKVKYAKGNILVDDMIANCIAWAEEGGTAILHKSAEDSINQLKKVINLD